jgi:hypothetical protein
MGQSPVAASAPKSTWVPANRGNKAGKEERQVHAAESIALYLDRIDTHLERIATSVASIAQVSTATSVALSKIAEALEKKG